MALCFAAAGVLLVAEASLPAAVRQVLWVGVLVLTGAVVLATPLLSEVIIHAHDAPARTRALPDRTRTAGATARRAGAASTQGTS